MKDSDQNYHSWIKAFPGFSGAEGGDSERPLFVILRALYNLTSKPVLPPSVYAVAKRSCP
jgi:hypothetical protein